jgi:hypothetical protein
LQNDRCLAVADVFKIDNPVEASPDQIVHFTRATDRLT